MIPPSDWIESVLPLVVLLIGGLLLLVWIGKNYSPVSPAVSCKRLLLDEEGAAYSLAFVITVPFYVFLICLVIESALILGVKLGTVYAAFAAARTGIVWHSIDANLAQSKARESAVVAMVPFASSSDLHRDGPTGSATKASEYLAACNRYAPLTGAQAYLTPKFLYADKATQVQLQKLSPEPNGLLEATVTYPMPLHVPGIGRLLGQPSPWGGAYYTITIRSRLRLPDEAPATPDQTLGVPYELP